MGGSEKKQSRLVNWQRAVLVEFLMRSPLGQSGQVVQRSEKVCWKTRCFLNLSLEGRVGVRGRREERLIPLKGSSVHTDAQERYMLFLSLHLELRPRERRVWRVGSGSTSCRHWSPPRVFRQEVTGPVPSEPPSQTR